MTLQSPLKRAKITIYKYCNQNCNKEELIKLKGGLRNDVFFYKSKNLVIKVFRDKKNFYNEYDFDIEVDALKILTSLNCPVPKIYFIDNSTKCIIMEYLLGNNLDNSKNHFLEISKLISNTHKKLKLVDNKKKYISPIEYFIDGAKKINESYNWSNNILHEIANLFRGDEKQLILGSFALHNLINTPNGLFHIDFEKFHCSYTSFDIGHLLAFSGWEFELKKEFVQEYINENEVENIKNYETKCFVSEILISILHYGIFINDLSDKNINSLKKNKIKERLNIMKKNIFEKRFLDDLSCKISNDFIENIL